MRGLQNSIKTSFYKNETKFFFFIFTDLCIFKLKCYFRRLLRRAGLQTALLQAPRSHLLAGRLHPPPRVLLLLSSRSRHRPGNRQGVEAPRGPHLRLPFRHGDRFGAILPALHRF